jgi:nicastrin
MHFHRGLFKRFRNSNRIAGVFIFHQPDTLPPKNGFSEDSSCPDSSLELYVGSEFGNCQKKAWNKVASSQSLISLDLPFPVILIKDASNITEIMNCYKKFNEDKDSEFGYKCSAELQSRMSGAKDSVTCISRSIREASAISGGVKFCDPLGSLNIFASMFEHNQKVVENDSLLILSARLDSVSMFQGSAMGADSTLTAIIALISVADTLRKHKFEINATATSWKKPDNILYSFYDGEAFDYIGSGRTVYDLRE